MDEKRALARKRVLKAGTIEFGGSAIHCTVRNLSTTGAALDVPSPVGIPEKFHLVLSSDALRFACRVAWRKHPHLPTLRLALKPHAASEACHSTRRPSADFRGGMLFNRRTKRS
jgi:hypothetical protein